MESDFYQEIDVRVVCRYFDFALDRKTGKWVVTMSPDQDDLGTLPPGQAMEPSASGLVPVRSWPYNEGWACRPWFFSYEAARRGAVDWIKQERPDLYAAAADEVRHARAWRAVQERRAEGA